MSPQTFNTFYADDDEMVMDLAADEKGRPRRVVIQLMPPPFSQGWIGNIRKLAAAAVQRDVTLDAVDLHVAAAARDGHRLRARVRCAVVVGHDAEVFRRVLEVALAFLRDAVVLGGDDVLDDQIVHPNEHRRALDAGVVFAGRHEADARHPEPAGGRDQRERIVGLLPGDHLQAERAGRGGLRRGQFQPRHEQRRIAVSRCTRRAMRASPSGPWYTA